MIKAETQIIGDDAKQFGPYLGKAKNRSTYFMNLNCGEESLTLNLKRKSGKHILESLIKISDALVENIRDCILGRPRSLESNLHLIEKHDERVLKARRMRLKPLRNGGGEGVKNV